MMEIKSLIDKTNLIEKNFGVVERHFYLGGKHWFVGRVFIHLIKTDSFSNDRMATDEEIQEFLKLKKEFDEAMI